MMRLLLAAAVTVAGVTLAADPEPAKKPADTPAAAPAGDSVPADLVTAKEKLNYIIAVTTVANMTGQGIEVEPNAFNRGVAAAVAGKTDINREEMEKIFESYQQEMTKRLAEVKGQNEKKGEEFLKANGAKEGVKQLPSGLQYKVLKASAAKTAVRPTMNDVVSCHYRGTLLDGTEFDSSFARKQPATFPVGGVIPGWTEILQLMSVGDQWQVFVPAKLAYGDRGALPKIQPGCTLVFDIELLEVKPKGAAGLGAGVPGLDGE